MKRFAVTVFLIFISAVCFHAQTVSGALNNKTAKRGAVIKGKIILEIPDDLHVNSSIPEDEFTIPTTIKLTGTGIRVTEIKYPKGIDRKFEFSETPINVYEKRAVINFSVFVPRNFRGKILKLRAVVEFQPCSTEVCYPPERKIVNLTATVR